ncbi:glycosyltransferase family 4 protein [Aquisphaera insulae]|uniref:glycosyltransferase family 4 protein n=1 Tax=Aquisphaera insulae TaxID=2712864 RepID=UPI002030EE2B|nr:glycosyltransferase family 4 protein [Aquisphaera insulae]
MVNRRPWFWSLPKAAQPHFQPPQPAAEVAGSGSEIEGPSEGRGQGMPGAGRRLLFVNQYYWPDHASTAQHLADLVESLAARGFECHVLCAQGTYKPGQPKAPTYEVHEGVHIHRVPATSLGRRSTLARMTDYLTFYGRAVFQALRMPRFDAVVTLTTPPIIGLIGTLLRRLKGTRHAYWSMDLHPDASLALRRMNPRNPVVRGLAWLSDFVYRHADRVVVLGPYMADRVIMKGVRADRLATIPVWSRRDEVSPVERERNPLRRSLGLEDKVVAMYSGNLGLAHSYDEFLEAARRLRDRSDIVFLFVGGGPRSKGLREAAEAEGLPNIRFLDYVPREDLRHSLSLADVHLISMRPEMTGIVVPGKLYGVMAAGRPALFVGPAHCETADTIRRAGCGFTVAPGDAAGVVDALTTLAADLNLAHQMGQKGRISFLASHERNLCCYQWLDVIRGLLPAPAATRPRSSSRIGVMTSAGTLPTASR